MRSATRRFRALPSLATAFLLLGLALTIPARTGATSPPPDYPPLPLSSDRWFFSNVSAPTLTPSATGAIAFSVGDPLANPITDAELTLEVYAFNGFPGNATASSVAGAPVLSNETASGASVGLTIGTVPSGGSVHGSVGVATSASTANGAYAVRSALQFLENGTTFRLESRGWFSAAQWAAATELPNGSATLNLSALGVSGVLAETAIVVSTSAFPVVLTAILVLSFAFVGVGAWIYFRRVSSSRSGTVSSGEDHQAPSAFGKRRTRDGD